MSPEKKTKKEPLVNPKGCKTTPEEGCKSETTSSDRNLSEESPSVDGDMPDPLWLEDEVMIAEVALKGENRPFKDKKPRGSACVTAKLHVQDTDISGEADVCVDTGADVTVCTTKFITDVLGIPALSHIDQTGRLPRLWSASGHPLKVVGRIKLDIYLGTYKVEAKVIVQDNGRHFNFLMGSDIFYGNIIFDRGKFLAFAGGRHAPIPVKYKLSTNRVQASQWRFLSSSTILIVRQGILDYKSILLFSAFLCALSLRKH